MNLGDASKIANLANVLAEFYSTRFGGKPLGNYGIHKDYITILFGQVPGIEEMMLLREQLNTLGFHIQDNGDTFNVSKIAKSKPRQVPMKLIRAKINREKL